MIIQTEPTDSVRTRDFCSTMGSTRGLSTIAFQLLWVRNEHVLPYAVLFNVLTA